MSTSTPASPTSYRPQAPAHTPPHGPRAAPHDNKHPSLLDEPPAPGAPTPPPPAYSASREAYIRLGDRMRRNPRLVMTLAAVLLIGAAVGLYFALRPTPQPDFLEDDMDLVLNYALLTDDFNNLPLDERLKLITDLVDRLKNMSAGDSAMMAMFASTIEEKARKQLTENMSRLAIDIWDRYAVKYDGVDAEHRGDYLDETFVEFTKMMESIAGESSNKSDEQRLAEVRRQAERDRNNVESGKFNPPAQALGRVFEFMNFEVGGNASPQQRSRGQLMMRDMMRHFRGDDVNADPNAKPAKPGAKPGEKPGEKPGDKPPAPGAEPKPGDEPTKPADPPVDKPAQPEPK